MTKAYWVATYREIKNQEFDSLAAAQAVYDSEDYKKALHALGSDSVVRDIRIIEAA